MPAKKTMRDRLDEHTDTSDPDACWIWGGALDRDGYGRWGHWDLAHRDVYTELVGPIPPEHDLDHLCRVRACVNPAHLEPVTRAENNRRMNLVTPPLTHCRNGHEYTPENTATSPDGYRRCRQCSRNSVERFQARRKAAS